MFPVFQSSSIKERGRWMVVSHHVGRVTRVERDQVDQETHQTVRKPILQEGNEMIPPQNIKSKVHTPFFHRFFNFFFPP